MLYFSLTWVQAGIGDPYSVVFHLPGSYGELHSSKTTSNHNFSPEVGLHMDTGMSEGLMVALLKLLKKYLMDDSVKIVDTASQVLRVSSVRFFLLKSVGWYTQQYNYYLLILYVVFLIREFFLLKGVRELYSHLIVTRDLLLRWLYMHLSSDYM